MLVVKPCGVFNAATAPEFEKSLVPEIGAASELIVDLADVENITSMGLRVLLSLYRHMEKQGAMRVVNAHGNVAEVLEVTGFSVVFQG